MARRSPVVLIVDDDDQVLDISEKILTSLGYQVIPATNGDAALEIIRYYRQIDLLMTDIVMPGSLDGWQLAHRAKQLRPELGVIYTTGYTHRPVPDEGQFGYGPLLPKPWRADRLMSIIGRRTVAS